METLLNRSVTRSHWLPLAPLLPERDTHVQSLLARLVLGLDYVWLFLGPFTSLAAVSVSAAWLIWRVVSVAWTPLDELVTHLGFEVPQGARVDLAAVKADAVTLHWKAADDRKTSTSYDIQVNGTICGTLSHSEHSLIISNLKSDKNYVFRIIARNAQDFKTTSDPIRVRTKPASSNDYYVPTIEPKDGAPPPIGPVITPFKILPEPITNIITAPVMTRESSNGPAAAKRIPVARRPSPSTLANKLTNDGADLAADLETTQHQLTEKLDEIGRDIAEAEKQLLEEEQEAEQSRLDHVKERDELRAALKEKDNQSKELRKKVSTAERDNVAAQNRKNANDRQLQRRLQEKQKVKDDTAQWIRDTKEMNEFVKDCAAKKEELLLETARQKQELQQRLHDDSLAMKQLEEDVKERSQVVKRLERERSNSPTGAEEANGDFAIDPDEEDRMFEEHMVHLEEEYRQSHMQLEEAKMICDSAYRSMQEAYNRSRQLAFMPLSAPTPMQPVSRASSVRHRSIAGEQQFLTSPTASAGFPASSTPSFNHGMNMPAPHEAFASTQTPYFNMNNGTTVDARNSMGMLTSDVERLTGGAPMSPSAGADLIPADLLSNADEEPQTGRALAPPPGVETTRHSSGEGVLPGLGAFAGSNVLPGLGVANVPGMDLLQQGPQSPVSVSSRSPSVFASPQASALNLAFHSPEAPVDSDGRSIRSGRSVRPASGGTGPSGSRFAQILGLDKFNRQRGKTWTDDSLSLGRLQSQSMPKDTGIDEGSAGNKRRNSSHSGNFFGTFRAGLGNAKPTEEDILEDPKSNSPRKKPFMGLGGKDGWGVFTGDSDRPVSPKPGSAHSGELPRPVETRTSWSFWPSGNSSLTAPSPLNAEWGQGSSLPQQPSRIWGSRYPSRRPSAQVGPSGGVSYDIREDDVDEDGSESRLPPQAPIGTKPSSIVERPVTPNPRLNPAAQDFKSLFSFGDGKKDKAEKAEKSAKKKEKDKDKDAIPADNLALPDLNETTPVSTLSPYLGTSDEHSPPQSRKSRDSRSIMTAPSESSFNDGSLQRASFDRTLDRAPSRQHFDEAVTPTSSVAGSVGKGSTLMQRLSRKSSSSKFALPSFQKKNKMKEGTVEEGSAEDAMRSSVSSLQRPEEESGTDTERPKGQTKRTWSTGFGFGKIGKGKGKKTEEDEGMPSETETAEE